MISKIESQEFFLILSYVIGIRGYVWCNTEYKDKQSKSFKYQGGDTITTKRSKLQRYVNLRLGNKGELEQLEVMFEKSFKANSYREFWWYWNPVFNYHLTKYVYKPLKKVFPNSIAMLMTFMVSGLLFHDLLVMMLVFTLSKLLLPFPTTISFTLLGLIVILSEKYNLNFKNIEPRRRVLIHLVTIITCFLVSFIVMVTLLIKYKSIFMLS